MSASKNFASSGHALNIYDIEADANRMSVLKLEIWLIKCKPFLAVWNQFMRCRREQN
jgi:hypothetical protein